MNFVGFCADTQDTFSPWSVPQSIKSAQMRLPHAPQLPWLASGNTMCKLFGSCFATRVAKDGGVTESRSPHIAGLGCPTAPTDAHRKAPFHAPHAFRDGGELSENRYTGPHDDT